MTKRQATIVRNTKETKITVRLALDGRGTSKVRTGIGFLDHMLELLAKHGLMDLTVQATGDLHVDRHHTNEDVGIALGAALAKALGTKAGIRRFGEASVPMEEALVRVVLDLCGRPNFRLHVRSDAQRVAKGSTKDYAFDDAEHFLQALTRSGGITLHVEVIAGGDFHHTLEAIFKALGRALDAATQVDRRVTGVPSTKGRL